MLLRISPRKHTHLIGIYTTLLLLVLWAYMTVSPLYQSLEIQNQGLDTTQDDRTKQMVHTLDHSPRNPRYFPLSSLSSHLDARFAKLTPPTALQRQASLIGLLHSFILKMGDVGITTWIAHGSLLAWHWNERIFPWEWDLDVHVHFGGLQELVRCCNGSVYGYGREGRYLLDINAFAWERDGTVDPDNRIDARWIDISTGLYVDITAVQERETTGEVLLAAKDGHQYRKSDVLPLRAARFEGVEVLVPHDTTVVLENEYGRRALVRNVFKGFRFDEDRREWEVITSDMRSR